MQLFTGEAPFPTRAEAVAAGIRLGRAIIDGKAPSHAVRFKEAE